MKYMSSFRLLLLSAALVVAPITLGAVVCPTPFETYAPCRCYSDTSTFPGYSDFIFLTCTSTDMNWFNLGDLRVEEILDVFLTTPNISQVSRLDLAFNELTRVPRNLNQFKQLNYVDLGYNNIEIVPSGSINLAGYNNQSSKLFLNNNQIGKIEEGALKGNFGDQSKILLNFNSALTRLEEGAFLPVLQQMEPYNGDPENTYIYLYYNPIDCEIDPCHLAWLIRDNPNMVKNLYEAKCKNGTYLSSLNPNTICPTTTTPTTIETTTPTTLETTTPTTLETTTPTTPTSPTISTSTDASSLPTTVDTTTRRHLTSTTTELPSTVEELI